MNILFKYFSVIILICFSCKPESSNENNVNEISKESVIKKWDIGENLNPKKPTLKNIVNQGKTVFIAESKDESYYNDVKFSHIIDSTSVIKLETTEQSLIGRPTQIKVFNNLLFILDGSSKRLLEFDMTGKFIRSYGKNGKGPGEYILPIAFEINERTKEVVILDVAKKNLLLYKLDGEFKSSINLKFRAYNFAFNKGFTGYVFDTHLVRSMGDSRSKQFSIVKTDLKGEIISELMKTNSAQNNLAYTSPFNLVKNNSMILFNQPFTNTIFKIQGDNYIPFFNVEFQGKTIPDKLDYNIGYNEFIEKITKNKFQYLDNSHGYFMLGNKLLFTLKRKVDIENYMYNLQTEELSLIDRKTDNLSFGFLGTKIGVYKNSIINYATPMMYLNDEGYNSDKYKNTLVQDVIKRSKLADNPILIFNWFKS